MANHNARKSLPLRPISSTRPLKRSVNVLNLRKNTKKSSLPQ